MSAPKRKSYTGSFKAKVGLEAIRGIKTVNEIGQEYGVHPTMVGQLRIPSHRDRPFRANVTGGSDGT